MKKSVRKPFVSFLMNTGLVLVSALVALVLVEWVLGMSKFQYLKHAGAQSQKYFFQYFEPANNRGFDIRPDVGRRKKFFSDGGFDFWSNNLGCFDLNVDMPGIAKKGYTLLVGDSFIWGFTDFDSTAGVRLESRLGQRVLKCGVPSYGPRQELLKAREIIDKIGVSPDKVILGYYVGNDVLNDYFFPELAVKDDHLVRTVGKFDVKTGEVVRRDQSEDQQRRLSNFEKYCVGYEPGHPLLFQFRCWLTRNSVLYQLYSLMSRAQKLYPPYELVWTAPQAQRPWMKAAWKNHLDGMYELIRQLGMDKEDVVVVIIPAKNSFVPEYWEKIRRDNPDLVIDPATPYQLVSAYFSDKEIPYIDLFPYFSHCGQQDLYWTFDGHWNSSGNQVMADVLYEFLTGETSDPETFCSSRAEH